MSDDQTQQKGEKLQDLAIDLNFVPEWARAQPAVTKVESPKSERRGDKRSGDRRGPRSAGDKPRGGPRGGGGQRSNDRSGGGQSRQSNRPARPVRAQRAPVRVSFIPDRDRLGKVVKIIRSTKRAYALQDIAHRFMANPAFFLVKMTMFDGDKAEGLELFQCKADQVVFLDEASCREHCVSACLEHLFVSESVEVDPPSGNFTCVGRCRLGGELLGPPNYHSYKAAVENLRKEKYAHLSEEAFRSKIEMVHEAEVVDAWKQEQSLQHHYRLKKGPEDAPMLSRKDAEAIIRKDLLGGQVVRLKKAIMPGTMVSKVSNERLARSIQDSLLREQQQLFSITLALRPALKHMHLHLFRAGKANFFVTGIKPTPLTSATVDEISNTLKFLAANPGCSHEKLLEALCPGCGPDAPEAVHHMSSLRWLIDLGHVIEFYDGSLAIPK